MSQPNASQAVSVTVVGMTDVGRVREHNEDSFLVMNRSDGRRAGNGEQIDGDLATALLCVVCDGMGGAAAGEVASSMAADRFAQVLGDADLSNATPDKVSSLMDHAVQQANEEILAKSKANVEMKGMGTTLTAAVATPARLFVSQVGDSRAYLLRKGNLNQITKDQSLIGQLIEEGTLTEEEAEKLGGRNIVLQAVGVEENLRVDTKDWPLLRGDVVLVCSDGLTGMVKDDRIREILVEAGSDLRLAVERLVHEANENGGRDNVTVVLARFEGEGLRAPLEAGGAELEKAGVSFKAPPPPHVPNPMRKVGFAGAVILALILLLFFVFRPTTANLVQPVGPEGLTVRLTLADPTGEVVAEREAVAGEVRFEGVAPGRYVLTAAAPHHFDSTVSLDVPEPGEVLLEPILMKPKPGTVSVVSATPFVHVSMTKADGTTQEFPLVEAAEPREFENVPAGRVVVEVTRAGFRTWRSDEMPLEPEGRLEVAAPPLAELKGAVVVHSTEEGVRVVVREVERGETVGQGRTAQAGELRLESVREGRHQLRAEKEGYEPIEQDVEVVAGATTEVTIDLKVKQTAVTIVGVPNEILYLFRRDGSKLDTFTLGITGQRPRLLEPGEYFLRRDEHGDIVATFEVRVGEETQTVRVPQ